MNFFTAGLLVLFFLFSNSQAMEQGAGNDDHSPADIRQNYVYQRSAMSSASSSPSTVIGNIQVTRSETLLAFVCSFHKYREFSLVHKQRFSPDSPVRNRILEDMVRILKTMNETEQTAAYLFVRGRERYDKERKEDNRLSSAMYQDIWQKDSIDKFGMWEATMDEFERRQLEPKRNIPVDEWSLFDPYSIGEGFISNWQKINPFPRSDLSINDKVSGVRCGFSYAPEKNINGEALFLVAHGTILAGKTAGPYNQEYFDPFDEDKSNFRNLMNYAAWYAHKYNKKIEMLSFRWSGANESSARVKAALFLKNYIEQYYPDKDMQLNVFAHSHGCNVINILSHLLNRPLNLLIYFACPVRDQVVFMNDNDSSDEEEELFPPVVEADTEEETQGLRLATYTPNNFNKLLYFFSTTDRVAPLGAISIDSCKDLGFGLGVITLAAAATVGLATAAPLLVAGGIKFVSDARAVRSFVDPYLFKIAHKKAIGIRVQCDAQGVAHGDVPHVATVLPQIFEQLQTQYSAHSSLNALFDLNYSDDISLRKQQEAFCMAIRDPKTDFPLVLDEDDSEETKKFKNCLLSEQKYSIEQMKKFLEKYGKIINQHATNSLEI